MGRRCRTPRSVHVIVEREEGITETDYANTYDERGNILMIDLVEEDGTRVVQETLTYDEQDRLRTVHVLDDNGVLFEQQAYEYDADDHRVRFVSHIWDAEGI